MMMMMDGRRLLVVVVAAAESLSTATLQSPSESERCNLAAQLADETLSPSHTRGPRTQSPPALPSLERKKRKNRTTTITTA